MKLGRNELMDEYKGQRWIREVIGVPSERDLH